MRALLRNLALLAILGVPVAASAQVPPMLPVQGTLYDAGGMPVDGTFSVTFTLYSDAAMTVPLWTESRNTLFTRGIFSTYLGDLAPLNLAVFQGRANVFVGVRIGDDDEIGPFRIATAGYAAQSAVCDEAERLGGLTTGQIVAQAIAEADSRYAFATHAQPWVSLTGVPAGFADGVDNDSTLTEAEVDAMVEDNGYVRADHTQPWSSLTNVPAGFADGVDNVLSEAEVDAYVSDNGYAPLSHTHAWSSLTGVPAGFADGVDNDTVLTESQVDAYVANNGYASSAHTHSWSSLTGVPAGFADGIDNDTDTVLSEAQVDAYVSNNGYATSGRGIALVNCAWSNYVNDFDAAYTYTCPNGGVVNGVSSYHDNGREDRRFQFYCCQMQLQ